MTLRLSNLEFIPAFGFHSEHLIFFNCTHNQVKHATIQGFIFQNCLSNNLLNISSATNFNQINEFISLKAGATKVQITWKILHKPAWMKIESAVDQILDMISI